MAAERGSRQPPLLRWSRSQCATYLNLSITTIRRYEGVRLTPQVDDTGVHWFDPDEVKALRAERITNPAPKRDSHGEVAARVFELFRRGYDLRDVVLSARVRPVVVRELYSEWLTTLRDGEARSRRAQSALEAEREERRIELESKLFEQQMRNVLRESE